MSRESDMRYRAAQARIAEHDALRAEVKRLRSALQEIVDYEPVVDHSPLGNEDCAECAAWRERNHPIQHMCEEHVRAFYRREDSNDRLRAGQHWVLRDIAGKALRGER